MTVAIAREVRTINFFPKKGQRSLSVNLGGLDVGELWQSSKSLGFTPELVHMRFSQTAIQTHALLWEGAIADTPSDMDGKLDELWDRFGDAVVYSAGQSRAEYLANGGAEYVPEAS
jgi:hypothetical protein